MSKDYQGLPIPQTPKQKAQYNKTYQSVYGTRVKIPPPGPEREALVEKLESRERAEDYKHESCGVCIEERERCPECWIRVVLELLETEEG